MKKIILIALFVIAVLQINAQEVETKLLVEKARVVLLNSKLPKEVADEFVQVLNDISIGKVIIKITEDPRFVSSFNCEKFSTTRSVEMSFNKDEIGELYAEYALLHEVTHYLLAKKRVEENVVVCTTDPELILREEATVHKIIYGIFYENNNWVSDYSFDYASNTFSRKGQNVSIANEELATMVKFMSHPQRFISEQYYAKYEN